MDELELVLDHVSLSVEDLARARIFYDACLPPLGIGLVGELTAEVTGTVACAGYGRGRKGSLWIAEGGRQTPTTHVCFRAPSRGAVREFYDRALGAGGRDNGPPGIREIYHPSYYAAFVLDPEGHNVEAVCFDSE